MDELDKDNGKTSISECSRNATHSLKWRFITEVAIRVERNDFNNNRVDDHPDQEHSSKNVTIKKKKPFFS